jgi:hypothetical protein
VIGEDSGEGVLHDEEPQEFLTLEQIAVYGRYSGPPTVDELDQYFVLDDEDRDLMVNLHGDESRLGFALQLTTLRFLGTFLDDPIDVPVVVLDDLAAQLGVEDASCVKRYVERDNTKWDHQRDIRREAGWRDYADAADELAVWLDRRVWNTGETSKTLFYAPTYYYPCSTRSHRSAHTADAGAPGPRSCTPTRPTTTSTSAPRYAPTASASASPAKESSPPSAWAVTGG